MRVARLQVAVAEAAGVFEQVVGQAPPQPPDDLGAGQVVEVLTGPLGQPGEQPGAGDHRAPGEQRGALPRDEAVVEGAPDGQGQ
nr:hypothetical protein [Nonomuraea solani]